MQQRIDSGHATYRTNICLRYEGAESTLSRCVCSSSGQVEVEAVANFSTQTA